MLVFVLLIVNAGGDGKVAGIYDSARGREQARYELALSQKELVASMRMPDYPLTPSNG